MAFNRQLFQKIYEVIAPESGVIDWHKFSMSSWEDDDSSCGTARCVAGWAIHYESGGAPVYTEDGLGHSEAVVELADRVGATMFSSRTVDLEDLAGRLLGLEGSDRQLFYTDEETAAEFVHLAAQGRDDEASEVLDR